MNESIFGLATKSPRSPKALNFTLKRPGSTVCGRPQLDGQANQLQLLPELRVRGTCDVLPNLGSQGRQTLWKQGEEAAVSYTCPTNGNDRL